MTAHSRAVEAKNERPVLSEQRTPSFCLEKDLKIKGCCRFLFELSCESEQKNISEVVDLSHEFGQQQEHNMQFHRRRMDFLAV